MSKKTTLRTAAKRIVDGRTSWIGSVLSVDTRLPQIVLTFDDGPDPVGTEAILRVLQSCNSRATFFVLLSRVRRYPTLLHEVVDAGHEVALHGLDHRRHAQFSYSDMRSRTLGAKNELEDTIGRYVRWFRPPYGSQTVRTWKAVNDIALTTVLWGPASFDWVDMPQHERVEKAQEHAAPGAILLCHDAFAGVADGAPPEPAPVLDRGDLIERILDRYADSGLTGCSLGDALEHGRTVRAARFHR
jgi:peptidoglycan/xylan/chitin deacetylase (PgdA/CDA1 family)